MNIWKKEKKRESKELPEKYKCDYQNIYLKYGKYPQSGKEIKNVSTVYDISSISQVYTNMPTNSM